MGDRGGVLIRTEDCWVLLYTHYGRSRLFCDVKYGLERLYEDHGEYHVGSEKAAYIFSFIDPTCNNTIKDVYLS